MDGPTALPPYTPMNGSTLRVAPLIRHYYDLTEPPGQRWRTPREIYRYYWDSARARQKLVRIANKPRYQEFDYIFLVHRLIPLPIPFRRPYKAHNLRRTVGRRLRGLRKWNLSA